MRNKFVYSHSIKICALGFDEFLESIFCILLVVEAFSLQKVVEMLEEVIVCWQEVRWIWQMIQNFIVPFIQLLKHWWCNVQSVIVMEKNWALSVNQCWLKTLKFSVHLIDLLNMLLRCNSFTGIQKAVVNQFGQQTAKQWPWHFFSCKEVWLWDVPWSFYSVHPLSWSSTVHILENGTYWIISLRSLLL